MAAKLYFLLALAYHQAVHDARDVYNETTLMYQKTTEQLQKKNDLLQLQLMQSQEREIELRNAQAAAATIAEQTLPTTVSGDLPGHPSTADEVPPPVTETNSSHATTASTQETQSEATSHAHGSPDAPDLKSVQGILKSEGI
jgi:hypothetical protein